jgi:tetratricopeptide (TPR) repeat protein
MRLQGLGGDGEALLRAAQAQRPGDFWVNFKLARALPKKQMGEAVGYYRAALAVRPGTPAVLINLGNALLDQGQRAEAVRAYRRAIALDPKVPAAHNNLGNALFAQGRRAEAVKAYRRAIALDPKNAHFPTNLGNVLKVQGKLAEAVKAYRRAIALDPKDAWAHYSLGGALYARGKLAEAVKEYRRAIDINPKLLQAHAGLGPGLLVLGRFAEARRATRRWLGLLPDGNPLRRFAVQQLRRCQELLALDRKLTTLLQGTGKPDGPAEGLGFADLCVRYKKRYAAAARFYADAFAAHPKVAEDLQAGHRYNAACAAALAGCGQGKDATRLEAKEKTQLRGQALTWLRADLALRGKQLTGGKPPDRQPAGQALRHWQKDPDLASVRNPKALAKLPEAERKEWEKLWAEVNAVLKKAGPKP